MTALDVCVSAASLSSGMDEYKYYYMPLSLSIFRGRFLQQRPFAHYLVSIWIAITHKLHWPKHQHQARIERSHIEYLSHFESRGLSLSSPLRLSAPEKLRLSVPRECVPYT